MATMRSNFLCCLSLIIFLGIIFLLSPRFGLIIGAIIGLFIAIPIFFIDNIIRHLNQQSTKNDQQYFICPVCGVYVDKKIGICPKCGKKI